MGGSIAGLTAALELLKQGFKPTVYERRPNPKTGIICAGGISLWAIKRTGLKLPKGTVTSRIRRLRIYAPNGHFWQGGGKGRVIAYTLLRDKLEEEFARRVRELGGEVNYNRKVGNQEFKKLANEYNFIVGADGLMGVTRRALNLPRPSPDDIHIGVQQLCVLSHHPRDRVDLYFGKATAPLGYAWIFPVGNGEARIGLGIPLSEKVSPKGLLYKFIGRIGAVPLEPPRIKLIPTTKPLKDPAFGNILLVGDAGNFCDPFTGGGIMPAIISSKAAAKAITEGNPKKYKKHVGWLISQNTIRYRLKKVLCELSDEELNELVWSLEGFTVHPTRMSLNLLRVLLAFALHKPRILTRHKTVRRMLGLNRE